MKRILKIVSFVLATIFVLLLCVSCAQQRRYEEMATKYLKEKYPGRVFEMISYNRENEDTSGRYHVYDNVKFEMYIYSSILITDSYSIDRANIQMKELLEPVLEDSMVGDNVRDITWIRKYKEGNTDGSFVEYNFREKITLDDLHDIYEVSLVDSLSLEDVAKTVLFLSRTFEVVEKPLDSVTYSFIYENKTYTLTLSTGVVKDMTEAKVAEYIKNLIENSAPEQKQFYWESTSPIVLPTNTK